MNRALIVDDLPENRYFLRALLEGHGFVVDEAQHGIEALRIARAQPPHLIIADLLMPSMDGFTLLRAWKADDLLRRIPFVVYTATYTETKDEQFALSLGADAFIIKPAEPEPLMARLKEILASVRSGSLDVSKSTIDEATILRLHNETLIRKLEGKMVELQLANQALAEDIRERQRVETELRYQKEYLDAIIANEPECLTMSSPEGRLEQMNPAGLAMLEVSSLVEAQQGTLLDFIPSEFAEYRAIYIAFLQRVCGGATGTLVYPLMGRRGTLRWLESHSAPLRDERRGITLMLSITRDITERLRLEDELRQAHKLEAIGRLAGGIAHDFNNQLTVIQGYSSLALAQADDERTKKYATRIVNAAERSAGLVRQLLTFARKSRTDFKPVDMHGIIDETIEVLERSISKKIRLGREFAAADATIMGDASLLQSALLNLALNARDAMPAGGEIRFSTSLVDLDAALRARMDGNPPQTTCLRITVSDNGQGMTPEVQRRIFEPFFSTKDPGLGTGLGLACAHGTIRQHHGDIVVCSELGKGTTFHLYLPRLSSNQVTVVPESVSRPAHASAAHQCVMVIDDEAMVASLMTDALSAHGYQVICKRDAVDAVAHYRQHWRTIDLVILDLNMPRMGGAEVFAAIRAANQHAKILLASGFSHESGIEDMLSQGARGFLAKPFLPEQLAQRVAQLLP